MRMNYRSILFASLIAFLTGSALAAPAPAAPAQPRIVNLHIALANPSKIFNEMKETQDAKARLETERTRLANEAHGKEEAIKAMQAQRNNLKPDHPQFEQINKDLRKAAMEYETWSKFSKLDAEASQKRMMKTLFDKIEKAVSQVAERDNIDLVISDQQQDLPDNLEAITFDQLRAMINSKDVLFASKKADISNDVIALLDSQFTAGAATAPPGVPPAIPALGAAKPAPAK